MPISTVIQKLHELDDIHIQLHQLGKQKRDVIIKNQIDELSRILKQESKLISQIVQCEQEWLDATTFFLKEKNLIPDASMTVTRLSKLVFDMDQRNALLEAQAKLMATINLCKEQNELNQKLIEQSLAFIDYSLDLIMGGPDMDVVYKRPDSSISYKDGARGIFDART